MDYKGYYEGTFRKTAAQQADMLSSTSRDLLFFEFAFGREIFSLVLY